MEIKNINISDLTISKYNVRTVQTDDDIDTLSKNIGISKKKKNKHKKVMTINLLYVLSNGKVRRFIYFIYLFI